ncbi:hypothetical protein BDW69DRAFT_33463 [Aspergillus filifer]
MYYNYYIIITKEVIWLVPYSNCAPATLRPVQQAELTLTSDQPLVRKGIHKSELYLSFVALPFPFSTLPFLSISLLRYFTRFAHLKSFHSSTVILLPYLFYLFPSPPSLLP